MSDSLYFFEEGEPQKSFISLKEFAQYAGISLSTAYKYSSSGRVPTYRPFGKHVFVKMEEIAKIFEANRSSSNAELESKAEAVSFRNTSIA